MRQLLSSLRSSIQNLADDLKLLQLAINSHSATVSTETTEQFKKYQQKYREFHAAYEAAAQEWMLKNQQEYKFSEEPLKTTLQSCDALQKEVKESVSKVNGDSLNSPLVPLDTRLGSYFSETIRLYRTIDIYQKWHSYLFQQAALIGQISSELSRTTAVQRLLTYQKKAFLQETLQQQKQSDALNSLQKYLNQSQYIKLSDKDIYEQLKIAKETLSLTIRQDQNKLSDNSTWIYRATATCLLGITQQPNYQLGQLASQVLSKELESYSQLPILREVLPPELQEKLNIAVGMSFLMTSLAVSNWMGYSYQFIATMNHFLLAQHDVLKEMGSLAESLAQYSCLPALNCLEPCMPLLLKKGLAWIKEVLRCDEQGLLEKEKLIAWLSGFAIQLMFTGGQNIWPASVAYMLATSCGEIASRMVEKITSTCKLASTTTTILKTAAHMSAYSFAYQYGYRHAYENTASPTERFSQAEALKLFGLQGNTSEKALKERYHQLALENHPDKCGNDCDIPMQDINDAYQTLAKKMK